MKNLKLELQKGNYINFSNDSVFVTIETSYGKTLSGSMEFKIFMNGKYIHLSKTFKSFEKKLISLMEEYDLIED